MERKIKKEKLYDLYILKDLSMKEVAETLGVGVGTVHRHIHKEEIPIKPTPEKAWNSGKTYKDDKRILAKERHPRYIDGRTYPSDFDEMKKSLLPAVCEMCGEDAGCLHHIDTDIHNNKEGNLQPLCKSCHTILHNKKRKSFINMLEARGFDKENYE
jgi:hypothetical protein